MGESSPSSLPQQWRAFCSSGPPVYLKIDGEKPYAAKGLVAEGFSDGKAVIEAELPCGRLLLFDFLGRRCVDLNDTSKNYHMCWVDASHQVYGNATGHPALPLPRDMEDSSSLRQQWRQFRRSGFPRAIAIDGEGGARTAVPCKVTDFVATAFAKGKAVVEARLPEGRAVLFDFLRKVVVDLDEPSNKSPIRWVDNQQRVFTNEPVLGIDEHKVARAFTEGTSGRFIITSIEKCLVHQPRIEAFKANIYPQPLVYGWYGGLMSDVKEAAYGSGVVNINSTLLAAGRAHGNAAHVSPMSQPYESAMLTEVDTKGEAHLLFCSIALGRQEVIPAGSLQNSPTCKPYDTGVDNKFYPSWYIFWSGWMHNQIVPLYVLSFIKNPVLTPGLSPFGVYHEIQKSLPPSDLQAVERRCNVYMKNQINTPQFVERRQQPRERPDNSCSIATVTPEVRTAKRRRGSGATILGCVPAVDPGRTLLNPDPRLGSVDPESGTCDPGFHHPLHLLCPHGTASNPSPGVLPFAEEIGDSSRSSLPRQWRQLCSSGLPVEVKIEGDRPCSLAGLEKAFDQGKAIFEVQYRGRRMLFDFLEKRCVDLDDPSKNYRMRWTDSRRKVYWNTTEAAADLSASSLRQQWAEFCRSGPPRNISVKLKGDTRFIPRATVDSIAATFTEKIAIVEAQIMPSGQRVLFDFLRKVIIDLDEPFKKWNISWVDKDNWFFTNQPILWTDEQMVRNAFTEGTCGSFKINSIQKCAIHWPHLDAFEKAFEEIMSEQNIDYGWYGGLASDVKEAVYGSGVVNINSALLAAGQAHGYGIHISPMRKPYESAMLSDADESGEARVLFCSLLLGVQEVIPAGSNQDKPNIYCDSGVDNKLDPNWYVVWDGMTYTQIIPLYVVSFIKTPAVSSSGLSPGLYDELRSSLPLSDVKALEWGCHKYMKNEIWTSSFVDFLSAHGGERLFRAVARSIADK